MKNNKHIVLVANTAWSLYNFRRGVISAMLEKKYQVTIVAPYDECFSNKIKELGCAFVAVEMEAKGTNVFKDIFLLIRFYRLYKKLKPDLIFHYTIKPNIYGTIACRMAKIKNIAVTTGLGYTFIENNIVSKIAHLLYKIAFISANQVWFLNKDDQEVFVQRKIVASYKTKLLNSEGINLDLFSPTQKIDEKIRFMFISRLLWDKGVGEFVEAARQIKAKYPNVIFDILGYTGVNNPSAVSNSQIQQWCNEGVVEYLGTTLDVRPFISSSSAIVLPSSYREGVPRILLEASAMERLIITTNTVGCKEVIEDGKTGFLCEVKSVSSLVKAIEKVIELSPVELLNMGRCGRQKMEREFDEKLIIQEYFDTLKQFE